MKTCRVCGESKPFSDYYRGDNPRDTICKPCERQRVREYRKTRAGKEVEQRRAAKPERKAWKKSYTQGRGRQIELEAARRRRAENREQHRRESREWARRHPEQVKARNTLRYALVKGELTRPDACERCGRHEDPGLDGRPGIEAHHADYDKPLEVEWLCRLCHATADEERRMVAA